MESGEKEKGKKELIKILLQSGSRVSVGSALKYAKTTEMRHYASLLKKEGLDILSEWVTKGDNRFKEYWLAPKN